MATTDRNSRIYGNNVVNPFFTFQNEGTWTASNSGSVTYDKNVAFNGNKSIKITNSDPTNNNTAVSIANKGTVLSDGGSYWLIVQLMNNTNEEMTGKVRVYKNTIIDSEMDFTLSADDEDIWIGHELYVTGFSKGDTVEFDIVLNDNAASLLLSHSINVDGFGFYRNDRNLALSPKYTSPVPIFKELFGVYYYNDLATQTTQIPLTLADTQYELTNDGAGTNTNKTYALTDVADVWNTTTNRFDFTGLELGDAVDVRIDIEVTTTGVNTAIEGALELGIGGTAYQLIWKPFDTNYKTAGTYKITQWYSVYMGDNNTLNNPARVLMQSDSIGVTVKVNGWYVRPMKRLV